MHTTPDNVELTKSYRGRKVVDNVSVRVKQGEVVGLLGPNGAGKTTSFYMIVGLITPDSGRRSYWTITILPNWPCTSARARVSVTFRRRRRCSGSCRWKITSWRFYRRCA